MSLSPFQPAWGLSFPALLLATAVASGAPTIATGSGPFALLHSLYDPNTNALGDLLNGRSIAIDGNFAVVGAPHTGLELVHEGEVKVYDVRTGARLYTLQKPEPRFGFFGNAVAISGTRIVVSETGDVAVDRYPGIVYVYDLASASPWQPVQILENPNTFDSSPPNSDYASVFGYSVAIDGSRVVVGAPYDDAGAVDAGSAFVFDLNSDSPNVPSVTLHNPSPGVDDRFGWSVAVSGSRVVIGATLADNHDRLEDTGRAYVYDLGNATPSVPVVTLDNPTPAAFEQFGFAVGISGTHVVVGARYDTTGADESGSAYVYDLSRPAPAIPVVTLNNPSPAMFDNFGFSVAISDGWVVVGALGDGTGAAAAGSAYVYNLAATAGTSPVMTLTNPSPAAGDYFGWSVALSGTRILVGAPYDDGTATDAGSVYVYNVADGTSVPPATTLTKPSLSRGLLYGYSTAISGTRLAVGAPGEGAVQIYDLNTDARLLQTVSNPRLGGADSFGQAVALSGASLVIGAPDANRSYFYSLSSLDPTAPLVTVTNPGPALGDNFGFAVAVSGSRFVVGTPDSGHAYVFDSAGPVPGIPMVTLTNPNPLREDRFGTSVAIDGTRVVVGAPWDDTGGDNTGIAYVYDLTNGSPDAPIAVLRNPAPARQDYFGNAVALSGNRVVVGAYSASLVVGAAGAAFVFDLSRPEPASPILTLPNPEPGQYDLFGFSVAISESLVVVGAAEDDFGLLNSGSAYAYDLTSATPARPLAVLRNPQPAYGGYFGYSVAVGGSMIVAGAPYDDTQAAGRGAAFVFGLRPTLKIAPNGPGFITISWTPTTSTSFVLQSADELESQNWIVAPTGATNPVILPVASTARFYRLTNDP